MSDVKRYWVPGPVGVYGDTVTGFSGEVQMVLAADYDALAADRDRLARELALIEGNSHPGYVVGCHWMATAYNRICAGEDEAEVMRDYGYARVAGNESVCRCPEPGWYYFDGPVRCRRCGKQPESESGGQT